MNCPIFDQIHNKQKQQKTQKILIIWIFEKIKQKNMKITLPGTDGILNEYPLVKGLYSTNSNCTNTIVLQIDPMLHEKIIANPTFITFENLPTSLKMEKILSL